MTTHERHQHSLLQLAAQARVVAVEYRGGLWPDEASLDKLVVASDREQRAFRAWVDEVAVDNHHRAFLERHVRADGGMG